MKKYVCVIIESLTKTAFYPHAVLRVACGQKISQVLCSVDALCCL